MTTATAAYDRAARPPRSAAGGVRRWEQGDAARRLQEASRAVARPGGLAGRFDRAAGMELVAALMSLTGAVARLRAAHGRAERPASAAPYAAGNDTRRGPGR